MSRHRKKSRTARQAPGALPPSEPTPELTYQCHAVAHDVTEGTAFAIGTHVATSPRLALRWLHERARAIADQLDPPSARPVRHWVANPHQHEHALATLRQGYPYAHTFPDDTVQYVLTAQPTTSRAHQAPQRGSQ